MDSDATVDERLAAVPDERFTAVPDERFTAAYWDDRYGTAERLWSGAPNVQLVAEVADLAPGTALDAGCGEGGDAHWLAARGWRVTALDVSVVALRRGADHAPAEVAERIVWRSADFRTWTPEATYDLVSAQYLHFPSALRERVYAQLATAVVPGGTLLIVAHEPSEVHTGMGHEHPADMFATAAELAAGLDPADWDVLVAESRPRVVQVDDREVPIADAVLRARRR